LNLERLWLECAAGQQRGFGGTGKEVVNQSPEIAAELKRNSRQYNYLNRLSWKFEIRCESV
jgi:hypothetical protein